MTEDLSKLLCDRCGARAVGSDFVCEACGFDAGARARERAEAISSSSFSVPVHLLGRLPRLEEAIARWQGAHGEGSEPPLDFLSAQVGLPEDRVQALLDFLRRR